MAIKKSEMYTSLYESCDKLRGGMDPSLYKNYILTLLFVKYISDKYAGMKYAPIKIPEGCGFEDFLKLRNTKNIGEEIDKALQRLSNHPENGQLSGMFRDVHFNDESKLGKGDEMVKKITKLLNIFTRPEFNFKNNKASGDDILGDAYEYLMRSFAVDSGKSKGQFYTPAEASRVLAGVLGISGIKLRENGEEGSVYAPACGSGSLLIRAANEAGCTVGIYGQEYDPVTAGLAKMNLVLHNMADGVIEAGNTFSDPRFLDEVDGRNELRKFDFVVVNPPFSLKNWTDGYVDYGRTAGWGEKPPEKNGDYAWVMHVMKSLKAEGRAAIILPLGVLFRGNAEEVIRKTIVDRGFLEGIIAFPPNIFFGTGIPACVLVITRASATMRGGVFMIDASRDFVKDGDKNRLRERDIEKIVSTYRDKRQEPHYSRFVQWGEIKQKNGYNLNIPRYIDSGIKEDVQDIDGHLNGGIPSADIDGLAKFWTAFPSLRGKLFKPVRTGYEALNCPPDGVRNAIRDDKEFKMYALKVAEAFKKWADGTRERFAGIGTTTEVKHFIKAPSMELIDAFRDIGLLDIYDVYEVLLSYWTGVMSDDVYLIADAGYAVGREIEVFVKEQLDKATGEPKLDKNGNPKVTVTGWDGKVIPRAILDRVYFAAEVAAKKKAESDAEEKASAFDEYVEEQTQEDVGDGKAGCLFDYLCKGEDGEASDDKVKVDAKKLNAAYKRLKKEKPQDEETLALAKYFELEAAKKEATKAAKEAAKKLEELEKAKYPALTDEELTTLIVDEKWLGSVRSGIDSLYDAVSNRLAERIAVLASRYESTLGELDREGADLEKSVAAHLKEMGY